MAIIRSSPATKWPQRSSSVKAASETIHLGRSKSVHNYQSLWQSFCRKISRRKRMIFGAVFCTSAATAPAAMQGYDAEDYSKNFDQGIGWEEPDNLPRSFSARFADPSRMFQRSASTCYAR
ncbi:hypothetical protein LINPERHAP1_LOCUS36567 [Linum perenne]